MEKLISKAHALAEDLQACEQMKNFLDCRNALLENDELKDAFTSLRSMYNELVKNGTISFDEERQLGVKYWDLFRSESGRAYFEAESRLICLLGEVYAAIETASENIL